MALTPRGQSTNFLHLHYDHLNPDQKSHY